MKINWKVRFKNRVWLVTFIFAVLGFVYQILDTFGVVPAIEQETVKAIVFSFVDLLVLLGVVVDPTTPNAGDSERALRYTVPGGTEEEARG